MIPSFDLPNWPTRVAFGAGRVRDLASLLADAGIRRPLVVCGATVAGGEILPRVEAALAGMAVAIYRGLLESDPSDERTARAFEELLRAADRRDDLRWLFELKVEQAEGEGRCVALEDWATVEEEVFGEPQRAADLLRRVVAIDATRTMRFVERLRIRYRQYATPWYDVLFASREEVVALVEGTGWRVARFVDDGAGYVAVLERG